RPHEWGFPRVEGHAPSPLGVSRVAWISVYRHAVVNTPVARWVLIARGTAYSTRFPFIPSDGGLPHTDARSATTLDFSRPAQRSLALRPVGSLHRLSDTSVSKAPTVSLPPPPPRYYPGTEEAHTNPTRQRGECLRALAGASGWYVLRMRNFLAGVIFPVSTATMRWS